MKKLVIILIAVIAVGSGCKEHDLPVSVAVSADSTYILPSSMVPAAAPHNVLLEDFSGQSCTNCVQGHSEAASLESAGNTYGVCYYMYSNPLADPPAGAKYDFRTSDGTAVLNAFYTAGSIPVGGVDRVPVAGTTTLNVTQWASAVASQKTVADSINLSVTSALVNDSFSIRVTATFLQNLTSKQNLNVYIVEDSIVDFQSIITGTGIDSFYTYNDVFRTMLTSSPSGDEILDTVSKVKGLVDLRKYRYAQPVSYNTAHCRVLAFLCNTGSGGDWRVIQTATCQLQ